MATAASNFIRFLGNVGGGDNAFTRFSDRMDDPYGVIASPEARLADRQALGRIVSEQTIPAFARAGGAEPDSPENIRRAQMAQLAELGTPEALKVLGQISPLGATAPDLGATGALAKRVMQDNPNMTFSDALAQVQSGFRKGLQFQGGQATPIAGYGGALGRIGGEEAYGTKTGDLSARMALEPALQEELARAEVAGAGKITPREQLVMDEEAAKKLGGRALVQASDDASNINTVIDSALDQADSWTTGFLGAVGSYVPGTPQFDLAANLRTIQADAAFDRLQQMRDASKTGGALGQVSERELGLLSAARSAVEQAQSGGQFKENLTRYKEVRNNALKNVANAYKEDYGSYPKGFDVKKLTNSLNTSFNSVDEALSANLPVGTQITINGRKAVVE
jgi:hypothetical protein